MEVWGKTDIGKSRTLNQDYFYCKILPNNIAILCVCDGMGGTNGGQIASEHASKEFVREISANISNDIDDDTAKKILEDAVESSNRIVYNMSCSDETISEMGTTLIGGFVINSTLYLANIGDSRCYHADFNKITQVTKDHSLVQQLLDDGKITKEETLSHPNKNIITRAVGVGVISSADIYKVKLEKYENIILCSDGLYNSVDDSIIHSITLTDKVIHEKCDILIDTANSFGGLDNITAIILQF